MPLKFFIIFFKNHGLFKIRKRPQWFTVKNRSKNYVDKVLNKKMSYDEVLKKSLERIIEKRDKIPRILEMEFIHHNSILGIVIVMKENIQQH